MNVLKITTSSDSTKKYYFRTDDSGFETVEACLLNLKKYGYIICVSTQIGCSQSCVFCASGARKFLRNLTSWEIQKQVELIVKDNHQLASEKLQITYMGSGEPLCNCKNVFESIDAIRSKYINVYKVNISTTLPSISLNFLKNVEWNKYNNFIHFQYSMHFSKDKERCKYMGTELLSIQDSLVLLNCISTEVNDIYKINYIPIDSINDGYDDIMEIKMKIQLASRAILKISEMSQIKGSAFKPSKRFNEIVNIFMQGKGNVEVFKSDGTDVNAGCGQFYNDSLM